jgi:hypothetical protein
VSVLASGSRKELEDACVRGRRATEQACRAALGALAVASKNVPAHLGESERIMRRGLRAKSRQLGDEADSIALLVSECAYEQWHRLLFARFLAENGLLIHPEYRAPVTLAECDELAAGLDEPDGWAVAGRFAAEILPGIFRLDDPCVQLRLAPEGRLELEGIIGALPAQMFLADDSLGWVYQFWQKEKKGEVNASERKIGGADLGPVTQLFTENYMVRFLLENSLGAWWASRHPDSPLVKEWGFLRFDDAGTPAAGIFDGWPDRVADVKVIDPCCGSGHFLVEAFGMLWRMRSEEEDLAAVSSQDAVLRDNLFGLELDPRCVQIAMFAVALTAWKSGGGWRDLPVPNVACSGIPVKASLEEWTSLAEGDTRLENALSQLHVLFRDADVLGSLIDPRVISEMPDRMGGQYSMEEVDWEEISPLLEVAMAAERSDEVLALLGSDAANAVRVADLLSRNYTLAITNVPYLGRGDQVDALRQFSLVHWPDSEADLANVMVERLRTLAKTLSLVLPSNWLFVKSFEKFRRRWLLERWHLLVRLGPGAFRSITGEVVQSILWLVTPGSGPDEYFELDLSEIPIEGKSMGLSSLTLNHTERSLQRRNPSSVVQIANSESDLQPLGEFVDARAGISTGDTTLFIRMFWEVPSVGGDWMPLQGAPDGSSPWSGRSLTIHWEGESGRLAAWAASLKHLNHAAQKWRRGKPLWGHEGVAVRLMGALNVARYDGAMFDHNVAVIVPNEPSDLKALWAFASCGELEAAVRSFHTKLSIESGTLLAAQVDMERWRKVAEEMEWDSLPNSDDPTQWLFNGRPEIANDPLQVVAGRLLGFCWPEQQTHDDLEDLIDSDGIVCVPSVLGEPAAAARLQDMLSRAYGPSWNPTSVTEALASSGSKKTDLESWLRDDFFKAHCQLFTNRPFIWQIWDGRKDGFAALVNYHRLDRANLERLTYTYLGDWIERQSAGVRDDTTGAEERLAAAQVLQRRLQLILEGEPPYDIYVRWKSLAQQPMGWEPDLNDGVRLNLRPFVEAGVLRTKFNVKWDKDRGKNPDGTERHNHLHYSLADKLAARKGQTT